MHEKHGTLPQEVDAQFVIAVFDDWDALARARLPRT